MKCAIVLLALIPLVFSAPEKRFFLDSFDLTTVKQTIQHVVDNVGTDATEAACEVQCHLFLQGDDESSLAHTLCNPICKGLQTLAHQFNIVPDAAPVKRFFLDSFDLDTVKQTIQHVVDNVGTDASEAACETQCHSFLNGDDESSLAHTLCTPICRGLQSLVHTFNIVPETAPVKRFFLDSFDLDTVKQTIQHVVDTVGSDASEAACEIQCHSFLNGDDESSLAHTLCTPICRGLQSLAHRFHIVPETAPVKRFFLDSFDLTTVKQTIQHIVDNVGTDASEAACETQCHSFLNGDDESSLAHTLCTPVCRAFDLTTVKQTIQHIVDNVGTDASEAACETQCHSFLNGDDESSLAHTLCTPVCRGLQSLAHRFHIVPETAPVKRFFLDSFDLTTVKQTIQHIVDNVGTDASEAACETQCHSFLNGDDESSLAHTLCTPVCRGLQSLAHRFHIVPETAPVKRFFLDSFDLDTVKQTIQHIVDNVGTDASEAACETQCHSFLNGDDESSLAHTLCTPICRGLQSLAHTFHIVPETAPVKRFFLDSFDLDTVKQTIQHVVDTVGSDASEAACEIQCHSFLNGDDESSLAHTLCNPICRGLQSLAHTFHIVPQSS